MGNPVAQPASMTNANKIMNGKHIALLRIGILPALVRLFPAASCETSALKTNGQSHHFCTRNPVA